MGHGPLSDAAFAAEHSSGDGDAVPPWLVRSFQLIELSKKRAPRLALSCYETALKLVPGARAATLDRSVSVTLSWPASSWADGKVPDREEVRFRTGGDGGEVFECAGCHNGVAANPTKAFRPVGGSSTRAHRWCEQVVLPTPSPRTVSLSSSQRLDVNKNKVADDPLWKHGILREPGDWVASEGQLCCRHGSTWPPQLVRHCLAMDAVVKQPGLLKTHKTAMLTAQKTLYNKMGEMHKALHEPQAAVAYHEHHVWVAQETGDRRAMSVGYGNLCKSHWSRAAKSKPLSWQEKRDESYAGRYLGKYKTLASEDHARAQLSHMKEKAQMDAMDALKNESVTS
mmetsp:Transcript_30680/g.66990  ORF Transcript_30680/g.66990 Transcript_30680/m.66990 type:complete len:340 (-) Transcript_30680:130-1149(-)|eukprot:CAMPEP_0118923264 /NCGR_PEP_ID=MMETSP1169-20130426/1858_1 /TAXON_ID=36882 /ORGANISM="Pyramimonas obovata, Strain CCMP722" /LENGTH=339 /DNA_ID=CAMNT_0006864231 /DNA_START=349 /DNA_END=1368 /DNA_ORIENTATION=+